MKINYTFFLICALTLILFVLFSCNNEQLAIQATKVDASADEIASNLAKIQSVFESMSIDGAALRDQIEGQPDFMRFSRPLSSSSLVLDKERLFYTYLGLSIKGSGGGGSFVQGLEILNEIYNRTDHVQIYDVSSVEDDKLYVVAGGIGAPTALTQHLESFIQSVKASLFTLANIKGKELGGVLSVESGSVNAMVAILLSIELGVPLINADGAGRSVPKLSNLSYAHEAYSIAPTVLVSLSDSNSNAVLNVPYADANHSADELNPVTSYVQSHVFDTSLATVVEVLYPKDADDAERLIRNTISKPEFGGVGGLALWGQLGSELKSSSVIRNTYSDALTLGLYTYLSILYSPTLLDLYFSRNNTLIQSFDGVLTDFKVETKGGFDITTLQVRLNDGRDANIYALNENLFMKISDGSVVTAPHLLSYTLELSPGLYYPVNNGDANLIKGAIGRHIHIVASYADKRLYDFKETFLSILKTVFGYSGPVTPPPPAGS